jgi:hypothetical protein
MPRGDGKGPVWATGRDWECLGAPKKVKRLRMRYQDRYQFDEPRVITKEEKKKLLEKRLQHIEKEKQDLEKQIKDVES